MEDKETFRSYYVELRGNDTKGQEILETVYIYNSSYYNYSPERAGYSFDEENRKDSYKIGDKVSLSIKYDNETLPAKPKARALYLVLRNGILNYTVADNTGFEVEFKKEMVPNFYAHAIYFDGVNMNDTGLRQIRYDSSESELKIDIKPDKPVYKPGETANLNINVTDSKGNPVSSELNLSVVDEAFFALDNQYVNTLNSIYGITLSIGIIADYA